ncbi:MAG TPA: hypothetical protein VHU81_01825 [Thermoanaerobaculia bacterium]|nr:hypothetical protein [Thermoanaerobaculia bacterium]
MPGGDRRDLLGRALRRATFLLLLTAVVLGAYAPSLRRPFTSEDFLLIRYLAEHPPWTEGWAAWAGPWLGISVVKFYRPLSTLLYALEVAAFGAHPFGYNLTHVLVHAANTVLVFWIARRIKVSRSVPPPGEGEGRDRGEDRRGGGAEIAAFLFAIYPLHPNAVLFSASFATIFGAFFLLTAFLAYQRFRDDTTGHGTAWWTLSLAGFLAALGSYEAAAVLPALLAAYDHLRPGPRRQLARVPGYLPFFGVLGLYFLLRRAIFGVFVGGYEEYSTQLRSLASHWRPWSADLATSIVKLHVPSYGRWPGPGEAALWTLLIVGLPLALLLLARRRLGPGLLRVWLLAWAWILLNQVPFAFRPAVPGNGRYWYLAVIGVVLLFGVTFQALTALLPRRLHLLSWLAFGAFVGTWGRLLVDNQAVYRDAGETAQRIQGELVRLGTAANAPPRLFLTRYPYFLENSLSVPVAQVYHYGVWDSVHPPFVPQSIEVLPLPPLRGPELLPLLAARPGAGIYRWDPETRTLRRAIVTKGIGFADVEVLYPAAGAALPANPEAWWIEIRPARREPGGRFRLIVVARGNATVIDLAPEPTPAGTLRAPLPAEFIQSMDRLYGGEFLWWVEMRDGAGALRGFSQARGFRLRPAQSPEPSIQESSRSNSSGSVSRSSLRPK